MGFRDRLVQVWNLECAMEGEPTLKCVYSVELEDTIPKGITFYGLSNEARDPRKVCVIGFLDGKL